MNIISVFLFTVLIISCCYGKSVTISWTTPNEGAEPAIGAQSLTAIWTHLQALQLAEFVPKLLNLERKLIIKLCPPQPYDPLVKEFTVPKLAGYLEAYDHECITSGISKKKIIGEASTLWWGRNPPKKEKPAPPNKLHGANGLSVPAFILEMFKSHKSSGTETEEVWLLNSDSLKAWLTAPILQFLKGKSLISIIPANRLLQQINAMAASSTTENDLKMIPQAVQGALVMVLPDYSIWRDQQSFKNKAFNPTWWITSNIPRTKDQIIALAQKAMNATRHEDQFVIIVHDPTPQNMEIVARLATIYGEKNLISATKVLPKTTSTFQLLQFIQKAADLVVDSRDRLGQTCLLAGSFPQNHIKLMQTFINYTTLEIVLLILLSAWFLALSVSRAFSIRKFYSVPLHVHLRLIALYTIYALAPIVALNPSMWPKQLSSLMFSIFEAGYGSFVYIVAGIYAVALLITAAAVIHNHFRKSSQVLDLNTMPTDIETDTESIHLIPKETN